MPNKLTLYNELIVAFSLALDLEENCKLYHSWRTGVVSWSIASQLNIVNATSIFYGGLLHDIGAIGLDDHIVHQVIKPNSNYRKQVLSHSQKGAQIVQRIPGFDSISLYILDHHEHWDGSGYPNGKAGSNISLGGQIIGLADSLDIAMRINPFFNRDQIVDVMAKDINKKYSPTVFSAFEQALQNDFFEIIKKVDNLEILIEGLLTKLEPVDLPKENLGQATAEAFASIIDLKHAYTSGHSHRVALYAVTLANEMNFSVERSQQVLYAGLLHDLGKIMVPPYILDKPKKLTEKEYQMVKKHPQGTKDVLSVVSSLRPLAPLAGGHHERVDGKGYPLGLTHSAIPLEARILAVADAYDAMTSFRPYQIPKTPLAALKELGQRAGSQFDGDIVGVSKILLEAAEYMRDGWHA
ncbi:MAG: HD domain-containing phosphohydrolase [Bacillota bacterium]